MNNFETKKIYISEEILVRDVVLDFLSTNYKYELERKAVSLKGGVIFIAAQPLIKKRILRDKNKLIEILTSRSVGVVAIR